MKYAQNLIALGLIVSTLHAATPSEFDITHDSITAALADLHADEKTDADNNQQAAAVDLSKINSSSHDQAPVNFAVIEDAIARLDQTLQLACKQLVEVKTQLAEVKQAAADQAKITSIQASALAEDLKNTQAQLHDAQDKLDQQIATDSQAEAVTDDQSDSDPVCLADELDEEAADEAAHEAVVGEVSATVVVEEAAEA